MLALHIVLTARIQVVPSILVVLAVGVLIVLPILVARPLVHVLVVVAGSLTIGNLDFPRTLDSPLVLQYQQDLPMLCLLSS